jgi:hypothetical protein
MIADKHAPCRFCAAAVTILSRVFAAVIGRDGVLNAYSENDICRQMPATDKQQSASASN